jgi:hypothetical protein
MWFLSFGYSGALLLRFSIIAIFIDFKFMESNVASPLFFKVSLGFHICRGTKIAA